MAAEAIRIEIPISVEDKSEPAMSNIINKFDRLKRSATDAGTSSQKSSQYVSGFEKSASKTEKTLSNWARQRYSFVLEAKDKVGPILSGIGGNLKSFAGRAWSTTLRVVDLATAPIQGVLRLLSNPLIQVGAVLGLSTSVSDVITTFKDFEAQMSQVSAISGATGAEFDKLKAKAKELGESTKFTATEVAQGFNYMGMAGWNSDQMTAGIEAILDLAAASGEDLGTTSDIVTDALTAFNMSADDATRFADVLAVASSNANTNVAMMGETFKYVGAASGALGYSIEDVALGIGLMANAGIKSSQAGTELNSIFTRLSTNTSGARDAIEQLGISFYDQNGNARDFGKVLEELRTQTKGMNNEQKVNLANTIAGQRAQAGLLAMLNATEADYAKVTEAIKNADGAAHEMSETMQDNLQGAITKLQSAWEGLKLKLGERIAPYLREFAEWLTSKTPAIAEGIEKVMDKFDRMAQNIKERWADMTGSIEWKEGGIFDKIKIAWDKLIIEPLSEWWNGEGKAKVAHFAGEFGNFLGTTLNAGISFLFGFDAGGVIDEGASVGKSFAKGFAEGFDFKAVASKVMSGIAGMFKSALKLFPGGEKAGLSSVLSAGLLGVGAMKIAPMLISLGKAGVGVGKLFKTVFGSGSGAAGAAGETASGGLGTTALGGLGLGKTLLGLGSKVYAAGGSGALSGIGASVAGLTAVAGGAIAGGTVISGGMDVYRAIKADDEKARAAYAKSAGWKFGGVAAGAAGGAAAGAALGSAVPVVGTLIGAGIGGIVGLIMGNREKKKYEEEMKRLEERRNKLAEVYKMTGTELDKMTFKSQELNDALEDTEMTAEEFGYLFQNNVAETAKKAFGNVKLSLSEIKSLAEKITFGKQKKQFEEFAQAAANTEAAYADYSVAHSEMKEQTWKVSLGMELTSEDIDEFKSSVDTYVSSAMEYVEKSQYEATVGARLIMGNETDVADINEFYGGIQKEIDSLSKELDKQIEIALEGDFKIDADEAEVINELQNKISDITNKVAEARNESKLEAIKIRYSGAELDYESFTSLQAEMETFKKEAEATLEEAYISSTAHLRMQIADTDDVQEKKRLQAILDERTASYKLEMKDLDIKIGSFNLQTIADAWSSELDVALEGFEGTTQEKLASALNMALAVKPNVDTWTKSDIIKMFGLDNISEQAKASLIPEIQTLASMISTTTRDELSATFSGATMPVDIMTSMIESMPGMETFAPIITEKMSPLKDTIRGSVSTVLNESMSGIESSYAENVSGISASFSEALQAQFAEVGGKLSPDDITNAVTTVVNTGLMTGVSLVNFGGATSSIGPNVTNSAASSIVNSSNEPVSSAFNSKWSQWNAQAQSQLGRGMSVQVPVAARISWSLINAATAISLGGAASGMSQIFATLSNAAGGYVSGGPQLSWLAEEGWGEYIIPTNPSRRSDALRLYEQAGKSLGVYEHAAGGYVGGTYGSYVDDDREDDTYSPSSGGGESNANVTVHLSVTPTININGAQDTDAIMDAVNSQMEKLSNNISNTLADQLHEVLTNIPHRKGA